MSLSDELSKCKRHNNLFAKNDGCPDCQRIGVESEEIQVGDFEEGLREYSKANILSLARRMKACCAELECDDCPLYSTCHSLCSPFRDSPERWRV